MQKDTACEGKLSIKLYVHSKNDFHGMIIHFAKTGTVEPASIVYVNKFNRPRKRWNKSYLKSREESEIYYFFIALID